MTRKSKARYGMSRTYRINPTVKALRAALMAGVLVSAAISGAALAAVPIRDIAIDDQPIAGDSAVYNPADLDAFAYAVAAGIVAISNDGDAAIINQGDISAIANANYSEGYGGGYALAAGLYVAAADDGAVANDGDIYVSAVANSYGTAKAYGIAVGANFSNVGGYGSVQNAGAISVSASSYIGNANATGIIVESYDDAVIENSGDISVSAHVANGYYGLASAIGIVGNSDHDVSIENSGDITVSAAFYNDNVAQWSNADAIGIEASGYDVSASNSGDISAYANNSQVGGSASAIGITVDAYDNASISNTGDIYLAGSSGDGGYYFNWGTYQSYSGTLEAIGLSAKSYQGDVSISNSGNITIVNNNPNGGYAAGYTSGDSSIGIYASTQLGDTDVHNSGNISITDGEQANGIIAKTTNVQINYCNAYYCYSDTFGGGDAYVNNSGTIDITVGSDQLVSYATGIIAGTAKYGGDATVVNSGNITIQNNSYNADVYSAAQAIGIIASTSGKYSYGDASVTNSGDIVVFTSGLAAGIEALSTSDASITNSGDITVTSLTYRARGLYAVADDFANITNTGSVSVTGGQSALGILASADYGVSVVNHGDLEVNATDFYTNYNSYYGTTIYYGGWAYGISAGSLFIANVDVYNSGDINVDAAVRGYGISTFARFGSTSVINHGDIDVAGHQTNAYGIKAVASGFNEYLNGEVGHSTVSNTGDISVVGISLAVGIAASQGYGYTDIANFGAVSAYAEIGNAFGIAGSSSLGFVNVYNEGAITVSAGSSAVGISATANGFYYYYSEANASVFNNGDIYVHATDGSGTGIKATTNYGDASVFNSGDISVVSTDTATGINAVSLSYYSGIENSGDILVQSSAGNAVGIRGLANYTNVFISNSGDIEANANQLAQGIVALSYNEGVTVYNNGNVTANSSHGYSQAVAMRAAVGYSAVLDNEGSIVAGSGNSLAVSITGGSGLILNHGDISGSILADSGNDVIRNYAGGRMFMTDDSILLGYGQNSFVNDGKLFVNGQDNQIDMGYYSESGVGLFINNGHSIHMNDGAANDALTIYGNFAGTGDVNVDVNGMTLSSDRLYINGNVIAGTSNHINVTLLSLPSAADMVADEVIDIVSVSGTSVASNFVLGNVNTNDSALFTTNYSLVFGGGDYSLAFDVTGLAPAGVLLSTASPAIQGMWFNGLGTMYQRQGAERSFSPDGKSDVSGAGGVWARYFTSNGAMSPEATRANFGSGGSQAFDFTQSGLEIGAGYTFSGGWTIGVLGGNQDGSFKPVAGGKGKVDGNTLGGYVTYAPGNGFYADLSYRSFDFDGEVFSGAETLRIDGDAKGYSLELGYGYKTASNLEVEPQLQYSTVGVDMTSVAYGSGDFDLTDGDASQVRAGVAMRKAYVSGSTTWKPYGALSYVHSSSSPNRYAIGGALVGGVDTSGGSALVELGADARYKNWVFNAGVQYQDGGAYDSVFGGQVNVRYSW